MPALTIRNIPDEIHRGLKSRAALHGRSTEAEVRDILAEAIKPEKRVHMGQALWELGRAIELSDADAEVVDALADKAPAQPMSFDE
jgi:antitoxin FitA